MIGKGYFVGVAVSGVALVVVAASVWLGTKRSELTAREHLAQATVDDIRSVLGLRTRRDRATLEPQVDANLTAAVRKTLSLAKVPDSAFTSLSSEGAGSPVSEAGVDRSTGPAYTLRRTSFRLRGLKLEELGRFLDGWRASQPLHVITSAELTRAQQGGARPENGSTKSAGDERFDVSIVLSTYVVARDTALAPRKDGPA